MEGSPHARSQAVAGSAVTVAGIDKATGTDADADGRTERTERRLERLKRMPVAHPDIGCFLGDSDICGGCED